MQPIGFAPAEITARVLPGVVEQHATEAAFLWSQRQRALRQPHYSLRDLADLDERVEAHLDGLRVAKDAGWQACVSQLASTGPAEIFVAGVLAFGGTERTRMRDVLLAGCALDGGTAALVSALGWLEPATAAPPIHALLGAAQPEFREIGMAATALHREDPGEVLPACFESERPRLRAAALKAAGELHRADLIDRIMRRLADADPTCRFEAAIALALMGRREGIEELLDIAETDSGRALRALNLALRALPWEESRHYISARARGGAESRLIALATGIVGDTTSVPWLIQQMEDPKVSRVAGEAFTMMTGVDLAYDDLELDDTSAGDDEETDVEGGLPADYEDHLPWPDAAKVAQWWALHGAEHAPASRRLCGAPITVDSAARVLLAGRQRQRCAAALELARLAPGRRLAQITVRGNRQLKQFAQWNS
jgi:uncharacterized protein (TIGR02270 family)